MDLLFVILRLGVLCRFGMISLIKSMMHWKIRWLIISLNHWLFSVIDWNYLLVSVAVNYYRVVFVVKCCLGILFPLLPTNSLSVCLVSISDNRAKVGIRFDLSCVWPQRNWRDRLSLCFTSIFCWLILSFVIFGFWVSVWRFAIRKQLLIWIPPLM